MIYECYQYGKPLPLDVIKWVVAILYLLLLTSNPVLALDDAVAGKSLEGIHLGMVRSAAYNIILARNKYGADWRHGPICQIPGGFIEDDLDLPVDGNIVLSIEILSRHGAVVQVSRTSDQTSPQVDYTFNQLKRKHHLKETSYGFDSPDGGGIEGYYFDDVQHGVCFQGESQDIFLMTEKPDTLIIHKVGVPVIAISGGIKGKLDLSEGGRVYVDQEDYGKRQEHDKNEH